MISGSTGTYLPVYPRVCGGTFLIRKRKGSDKGLSPRVRGNLRAPAPALRRSIPACAGEPRRDEGGVTRRKVYPRVCGGTTFHHCQFFNGQGLSPRVRGNREDRERGRRVRRSIPACAGEPVIVYHSTGSFRVYPRVCGGTPTGAGTRKGNQGLSPRVRGNPAGMSPHAAL